MSWQSCYPWDLTDNEWALVERLLPEAGSGGGLEKHPRREVVDAILYVVCTGCPWRQLPSASRPGRRCTGSSSGGRGGGSRCGGWTCCGSGSGRAKDATQASAGIIDLQSVKAADIVGRGTAGMTRARSSPGTSGSSSPTLWACWSRCAWRPGPRRCQERIVEPAPRLTSPRCRLVFVDAGFAGRLVDWTTQTLRTP